GAARGRAHAQPGNERLPVAPGIAVRDSDLQVAEEQEAEPPGLQPERLVLLVRKQLAEAEDRDLLRLRRVQRRAPDGRIRRKQRSIRVGPSVPIRLAMERFERPVELVALQPFPARFRDRKSTRLNSSHVAISYAVFCLKKKKKLLAQPVCCHI